TSSRLTSTASADNMPRMMRKTHERRRAPRAPVLMSVGYEADVLKGDAQAVDLSSAGLFLGTANPLPVGTVLRLSFGSVSLRVRVARVVEPGAGPAPAGRRPGMGVAIVDIDAEGRRAL